MTAGQHAPGQRADGEGVAVGEQVVELATIHRECIVESEDLPEVRLHGGDAAADGHAGAGLRAQPGGGREVVGHRHGAGAPSRAPARAGALDARRVHRPLTERRQPCRPCTWSSCSCRCTTPAAGLWEDDDGDVQRDDVVLVEVMADHVDHALWRHYRESLEQRFRQDEVLVRATAVERL